MDITGKCWPLSLSCLKESADGCQIASGPTLDSLVMDIEQQKTDFKTWAVSVCHVIHGIPRGHVLTYGEVARLAGPGGSARRVSMAMRYAPDGMKLPWHRVINAQGKISFPEDSPYFLKQKKRLEQEGVTFKAGVIDLKRFGYKGALDVLLWGTPPADGD